MILTNDSGPADYISWTTVPCLYYQWSLHCIVEWKISKTAIEFICNITVEIDSVICCWI